MGFLYDSDAYNDDLPYFVPVASRQHLVLPYAFDTNDMQFQHQDRFAVGADFATYVCDAFDWLWREGADAPRMMSIGLHLRICARPGRIGGVEKILDHMRRKGGVWFATREAIAPALDRRDAPARGGTAAMTRILVINPNTSIAVSDVIRRGLAAMAMADVAITVVNAPFGAEAIETPAEACIAAYAVLATLADHRDDADAVVVGAFGDPGLDAARSVMIAPVVGTAAAAFTDAAQDGRRFAVITLGSSMESSIRAAILRHGFSPQLTGIHFLDTSVLDFTADRGHFEAAIRAQAQRCIDDGAEAIVLGGAPFTGMGAALTAALRLPVLAGLEPAVRAAHVQATRPSPLATHYSSATKRFVGLSDTLISLLNGGSSQAQTS